MDLAFLRPLYESGGPVASACLDTTRDTPDAEKMIELRWRALREDLARQGADDATLDAMESVAGGVRGIGGPQGEAVFAADGEVLAVHTMASPPVRDRASWLPVPDPFDLVLDRGRLLPYVVAAVDREGADVFAYDVAVPDPATARFFNGGTLHVHKVRGGGMASSHYQRHSENVWEKNAEQVAQDVARAVRDVGAAVVFVGGDQRAIGLLRAHLDALEPPVVELPGGRADHDAAGALRASVDAALEDVTARSREDVIDDFHDRISQGTAVDNAPGTLRALTDGQVETLLLGAERDGEPWLYGSPDEPRALATVASALPAAADGALHAPATPLMLRSAVLGDAGFSELTDGAGTAATLRFAL
ncbi:Vms1/Ankzf1 family peptidyl-tRNA hydrolase [Actinomadura rayongensis]|uniref:baeRF2 domain-containing protein n=1 Tax=Actinomadura rayongensis TaxID=1429076 RepID=UPI001928F9FD|nr:Vms1/Ankzf1 family peptidyl-tRNA hydrolase [Actinomadura rayongensis]